MIDKFNFYDIYGYLLPGVMLLVLLWIPFGLLFHSWPEEKLTSAILGLIIAYLAGHMIQISVEQVMPPKIKDVAGHWRFPSSVMLDRDGGFRETLRSKVIQLCRDKFNLDISGENGSAEDDIRRQAFYRARSLLLQNGKKSYWEQFEGLYAMTGGIVFAVWLAACYFVGWAIALFSWTVQQRTNYVIWLALIFSALALLVAAIITLVARSVDDPSQRPPQPNRRIGWERCFAVLVVILGCLGGILPANNALQNTEKPATPLALPCAVISINSQPQNASADKQSLTIKCEPAPSENKSIPPSEYRMFGLIIAALALGLAAIGFRFKVWNRELARHFAINVWQDFSNLEAAPSSMRPE